MPNESSEELNKKLNKTSERLEKVEKLKVKLIVQIDKLYKKLDNIDYDNNRRSNKFGS